MRKTIRKASQRALGDIFIPAMAHTRRKVKTSQAIVPSTSLMAP